MTTTDMRIRIKKGLDLPVAGPPEQSVDAGPTVERVALVGLDYLGLHPAMQVEEGERVGVGQPLFVDRHDPEVRYVSPGAGTVEGISRGPRRVLQSVTVRLDPQAASDEGPGFEAVAPDEIAGLGREHIASRLLEAGLWPALRTRPYSKVPRTGTMPSSIFVPALDSNPLAADPAVILAEHRDGFVCGVLALAELTRGAVHVCKRQGAAVPVPAHERVLVTEVEGPHPAGLVGTHIHHLDPVGPGKTVWHVGYQDVVAIGRLLTTGRTWVERVVSLAGPCVREPRLLRTRLGASTEDLVRGELTGGRCRVVSGSLLSGRRAAGWAAYLGRYDVQVSVLPEGGERELLGWLRPGSERFSLLNAYASCLRRGTRRFAFGTSRNGSPRAMVPIGVYERVLPLDVLATPLLRSLLVRDLEQAQALGALELDEEDLALCSFVCPGKHDFGPALRDSLERIEKE